MGIEGTVDRVTEVLGFDGGRVLDVIVNCAAIDEDTLLIQQEDVRGVGSAEGVGYVLVFVTQVGEEKALLSGKDFHFLVAVFRKLYRVIGVHRDECYAFGGIVLMKRFEPIED